MHDLATTLCPRCVVAGVGGGLCLLQGDLGSAIVLAAIVFAVAFIGGSPLRADGAVASASARSARWLFVFSSQRRFKPLHRVPRHRRHTATTSATRRTRR